MRRRLHVTEAFLDSFDGTEIAWHRVGRGAPPVLLCNGLGGSWKAWWHQIEHFSGRHPFVSWDYRGLYRSAPPRLPDALRVEEHALDGLAVMDAAGLERAMLFGWSMGVQVALELFRRAPERVEALVLMSGVAGRPWESVLGLRPMRHLLPPLVRTARRAHRLVEHLLARVTRWPEAIAWAKRIGLAAPELDEELLHELAESFTELDMDAYLRILELLGEHDAHDVLPHVRRPALVVVGDRDVFTPRAAAERMVRALPEAELLVVPGGTHYVAVEHPELINLRIDKFLRERALTGAAAPGPPEPPWNPEIP